MAQETVVARETAHKAAPTPISIVAFEILEKCNLYCDFCVRSASYKLEGMLTLEQFEGRLKRVKEAFGPLHLVALTGGEPFLHPNIYEFVKAAKSISQFVSITTNATVHKIPVIQALAELNFCHLIISLDGPDAVTHDFVRGKAGAFDGLVKFTQYCNEAGLKFLINMTVNEKNYEKIYQTAKLASELGARDISVALVKPEGRGKPIEQNDAVFAEVGRQTLSARRDFASRGLTVRFTDPLAHIFDVALEKPYLRRGCGANSGAIHIQCGGKILICTSCKEGLGNIEEPDLNLRERYVEDGRLCKIADRTQLGGACGDCEFVEVCGGCRCRSINAGEGFAEGDPLCPKNKSPFSRSETEKAMTTALARISPKSLKSPKKLIKWLEDWRKTESFDRENRDFLSQKRWGHNIDLGDGTTFDGEMGWRHQNIIRRWIEYGALPANLDGMQVLDVEPWTGGSSVLLAALGAQVDVVEESNEYREAIEYLAKTFFLPIKVIGPSIFGLSNEESRQYDYIQMCGTLSHLSDPLVALRTAFNHLKDGGRCLIETQTSYAENGEDEFWGPGRLGWVWLNPSRLTLLDLLKAAGFQKTVIVDFDSNRRLQLFGQRDCWTPMISRKGLSVPDIA